MFVLTVLLCVAAFASAGAHVVLAAAYVAACWLWREITVNDAALTKEVRHRHPGWRGGPRYRAVMKTLLLTTSLTGGLMAGGAVVVMLALHGFFRPLPPELEGAMRMTDVWLWFGMLMVAPACAMSWLVMMTDRIRTTTFGKVFVAATHLAALSLGIAGIAFVAAMYVYPHANTYPVIGIGTVLAAPATLLTVVRVFMTAAPESYDVE